MSESGEEKVRPPGGVSDSSSGSGEAQDPSGFLLLALSTRSPDQKRYFARSGLELLKKGPGIAGLPSTLDDEDDDELVALLLRQIYLAELEEGNDEAALRLAEQMVDLGTLGDVARQDAARAAVATGDIDVAIGHLRIAARVCPAGRRAFHYAHLGSLLRFDGKIEEAVEAFHKARHWATEDRDLYRAQLALAEAAAGRTNADLQELRDCLENEAEQKAYALWVLGELCVLLGDPARGSDYLQQFLERQKSAPRAKSLSLRGEVEHASALLKEISA